MAHICTEPSLDQALFCITCMSRLSAASAPHSSTKALRDAPLLLRKLVSARSIALLSQPKGERHVQSPTIAQITLKYLAWCQQEPLAAQPRMVRRSSLRLPRPPGRRQEPARLLPQAVPRRRVGGRQGHVGATYKRGAIVAVQRCLNWAEEMGHIECHPLKKVKKPPAGRRDNPMMPEDFLVDARGRPRGRPLPRPVPVHLALGLPSSRGAARRAPARPARPGADRHSRRRRPRASGMRA